MSIEKDIFEGYFGLERETFRVDGANRFASPPHMFKDDHLSRDFCENQLEIITPALRESARGRRLGLRFHRQAERRLTEMN